MVGFNVILLLGAFLLSLPCGSYSCQALRVILAPNIQNGIKGIKKTHRAEKCNLSSLQKIRKHLTFYFPGWALLGQIRTNILFQWVFWGSRHSIGYVRAPGAISTPCTPPDDLCLENTPASAFLILLLRPQETVTLKMARTGMKLALQELTVT